MLPPVPIRTLAVVWLGLFATTKPAGAGVFTEPTAEEKRIVEDPSKGLEGAVYLEKEWLSTGTALQCHVRAKILSKAGFDVGTVDGLDAGAYDIEGRTVSPDGRITELPKDEVRTLTTARAGSRSLARRGFTLPGLEPGAIVEYRYTESGPLGHGGGYHVEILFQDRYRILRESIRTPKFFPYTSRPRLQNGVRIDLAEEDGHYLYRATDSPAFVDEPYGLPRSERGAAVVFAHVFAGLEAKGDQFWHEITKKGFIPHLEQQLVRPFRMSSRLMTIPGDHSVDPRGRLLAIYENVRKLGNRNALRFSESPPKGGFQRNEDALDTIGHGSGNPHDLCGVFESLLRADGWKFRRIFLADRRERFFHREIPSIYQLFGGEVVEVRDPAFETPILVSFEHPMLPLGLVPPHLAGISGWAVDVEAEAGSIVQVPLPPSTDSVRKRSWEFELAEDGSARLTRTTVSTGYRAFEVRSELLDEGEAEVRSGLRRSFREATPPWELESVAIVGADDPAVPLSTTLTLTSTGFGSSIPGRRFDVSPLAFAGESNPFTAAARTAPVILDYTRVDEDDMILHPPDGLVAGELPKPVAVQTSAGDFRISAERREDGAVVLHRRFELRRPSLPADRYADLTRLFEAADREDHRYSVAFVGRPDGSKGRP